MNSWGSNIFLSPQLVCLRHQSDSVCKRSLPLPYLDTNLLVRSRTIWQQQFIPSIKYNYRRGIHLVGVRKLWSKYGRVIIIKQVSKRDKSVHRSPPPPPPPPFLSAGETFPYRDARSSIFVPARHILYNTGQQQNGKIKIFFSQNFLSTHL